jgi:hypothetical protein
LAASVVRAVGDKKLRADTASNSGKEDNSKKVNSLNGFLGFDGTVRVFHHGFCRVRVMFIGLRLLCGARFYTEIYTRGCHWFPRLCSACSFCMRVTNGIPPRCSLFLPGWHCKLRPNTDGNFGDQCTCTMLLMLGFTLCCTCRSTACLSNIPSLTFVIP